MADLRNGETAVDVARNESIKGDSGKRARSADSVYLLAGGSSSAYGVTINYKGGHFCKQGEGSGGPCKGNLHGKGQKFGPIHSRDTRDSNQWCKHVQAVLANPEQIAMAREITDHAFGLRKPVERKPTVESAAERLRKLEAQAQAVREEIEREAASDELRGAVADLINKHGRETVRAAFRAA